MNKTAFKIFICFTFTAAFVAVILLIINFMGFAFISSDTNTHIYEHSPKGILDKIDNSLIKTENGFQISDSSIIPSDCWCILINESGDMLWSQNKPNDIPSHYSINDIAKITRWFLNDYPVYVRILDYGLIIFGLPKNSVGKYDMEYSMKWFDTLPDRLIIILLINICLAAVFAFIIGINLYRHLCCMMQGINDLRQEKSVYLKERGIFKEISRNINITAASIERKNLILTQRDNARSNWISGVSHDIRTPLSVIMGYSVTLAQSGELSTENKNKAETITKQSIKIKKLIDDLNLISSLEYDMQPSKKSNVYICPLIRRIVTDIINSGLPDKFEIELDLRDEKAAVFADGDLIERALFNLINNSISHNKAGCHINITEHISGENVILNISDNGVGVPGDVIENITEIPKSVHGLGLPMAYKIISVHGGKFTAVNDNGFSVKIELILIACP